MKWVAKRTVLSGIVVGVALVSLLIILLVIFKDDSPKQNQTQTDNSQQVTETPEQAYKIAAAGDFEAGERFEQTLTTIAASKADVVFALGDLSYGKISEQAWCDKVNAKITSPFQIVPGNHDIESKSQLEKFTRCLPNRIPDIVGTYPDNYYFDKEDLARIIVVSPDITVQGYEYAFKKGDKDYAWLEKTITDAKQKNIKWLIIAMHKNCLTIGEKSCEIGQDLNDLLLANKVDLILHGHEHGYMRSKQLVVGPSCPSIAPAVSNSAECVVDSQQGTFKKGSGSLLAIVGTGGVEQRDINLSSPNLNLFERYFGKNNEPVYGSLVIELTSKKLEAKLIQNQTNQVKDSFTISN